MYDTALEIGTILQGKTYSYRIEKILGQGSFGITYMASILLQGELGMLNVNTQVAIKEFFMRDINGRDNSTVTCGSRGGVYDKYKQKFAKEAINLSRLKHPNIINVLESFNANNTIYYVMDYIDGSNLDKYIEQQDGLPESEAISLMSKIGNAVTYMHNNKMLHLDIKPSNIMLRKNGEPILIDFGLSKQYDENGVPESSTSIGGGTPGYAPIEQFNYHGGEGTLPVTMDVHALGGTLYKMLTGKTPPEASINLNNGGVPIQPLDEKNISKITISAIKQAMSPMVAARYATVQDFITALPSHNEDTIINEDNIINVIIPDTPPTPKSKPTPTPQPQPTINDTIHWIDIKQLLETIPYKTRYASVSILAFIATIGFIMTIDTDEIEWMILTLGFIVTSIILSLSDSNSKGHNVLVTILTLFGSLIFLSGVDDCWDHAITLLFFGMYILAIILGATTHSGIISKIYNIEALSVNTPYRRIQNRHGKWGLCHCGKMKISSLLPMRYNRIEKCDENAYLCYREGMVGLYNAQMRKMVLPISKNPITIIDKDTVAIHRNGKTHKYTTKGYRIPE